MDRNLGADKHNRTRQLIGPVECDYCQREFARRKYLTTHMKIHMGSRVHTCTYCEKKLQGPYALKIHIQSHTRAFERQKGSIISDYITAAALAPFLSQQFLREGMNSISGYPLFIALISDYLFAAKVRLVPLVNVVECGQK